MKKQLLTIAAIATLITTAKAQTTTMTLNECMIYAVENSFRTQKAQTDAANAKLSYTGSILSHLPSLSGSIGANSNFGRGIDPETNSYVNTSTFGNSINANASIPVFAGLRYLNQTRSAKIAKLRGEEAVRESRDRVAEITMATYAEVVYNEELLQLYQQRVENYKQQEHLAARKSELGTGSESDLAQIRATLAAEEYNVISAKNRLDISIVKLKDCMNFPLEDSLSIEPAINETFLYDPEQSQQDIVAFALENNSQAIISKQTLSQNKLALSIARGSYYPTISASGSIGTSFYTRLDGLNSNFTPYGTQLKNNLGEGMGLHMSVPIFNALRTRLEVSRQKNNYQQAQRDNKETLRNLTSEIQQAILELEANHAQWVQAQKNVTFQRIANQANRRKYTEGMLGIIELQTSDNQLTQAEIELRNSYLRYQIKIREVNYYKGVPYIK